MFPPDSCVFPEYHLSMSLPFRLVFFPAPVGGHDLAVQDQVGQPLPTARSRASCSPGAFAASTSMTSSLYRYAVDCEIPNPAQPRDIARSRNHASANSACF